MSDSENTQTKRSFYRRPSMWWVAVVCLVIIALWFAPMSEGPSFAMAVYTAACIALLAATGVWLAFGESIIRYPAILVSILSIPFCLLVTFSHPDEESLLQMLFLSVLTVGAVSFPLVLSRAIKGARLRLTSTDTYSNEDALQFNILHLFIATTFVASLLVAARILRPIVEINSESTWFVVTVIGLSLSACSLVAAWATLGSGPIQRGVVSVVAVFFICVLNYWMAFSEFALVWAVFPLINWLLISSLMWALRWEGYRFVVKRQSDDSESKDESDESELLTPDPFA